MLLEESFVPQPPELEAVRSFAYPMIHNDNGLAEIRVGMKEFECIGASPPHDHPHIYITVGHLGAILCPYCNAISL